MVRAVTGSEQALCALCEGVGVVAKNFGLDSPGFPDFVECPDCGGDGVERSEQEFRTLAVILTDFLRDQITTGRRDPVGERDVLALADELLRTRGDCAYPGCGPCPLNSPRCVNHD